MKIKSYFVNVVVAFMVLNLTSCKETEPTQILPAKHTKFDTSKLLIKEDLSARKVHGQVLYLPVYSNIPNPEMGKMEDIP